MLSYECHISDHTDLRHFLALRMSILKEWSYIKGNREIELILHQYNKAMITIKIISLI